MADGTKITIERVDGGILAPSATWKSRSRAKNATTMLTTYVGSGPAFELDDELQLMRGVITKDGMYRDHTVVEGAPGIYDQVTVNFHAIINPPIYLYDFKAPTKSIPLGQHPNYKTFWDHNIVSSNSDATVVMDVTTVDAWHAQVDTMKPTGGALLNTEYLAWNKANQAVTKDNAILFAEGTDGWGSPQAKKRGQTSFLYPSVSIRESVYFVETRDFTMRVGPATFTQKALNTKNISAMSGKAGWPFRTTFGYPKDVYTLLNDVGGDYSDYRHMALDTSGTSILVEASFYEEHGIPVDQYITSSVKGEYKGAKFGHPLWFCSNVSLKKIGYWYQATLDWQYFGFGVDPDTYPLATGRVAGLV